MPNSQRVLIEMLHWACAAGAIALNYTKAVELRVEGGVVHGIEAQDRVTGQTLHLEAPVVYNCAGPWSRVLGEQFDRDVQAVFEPSLAFNVLLDREPLSDAALAVEPPGGPMYFMHPCRGRIFAGTSHWPWSGGTDRPHPTDEQLEQFLDDLNRSAPALRLTKDHVLRVFAGLLPSRRPGSKELAVREAMHDHGRHGGPRGLFSLAGSSTPRPGAWPRTLWPWPGGTAVACRTMAAYLGPGQAQTSRSTTLAGRSTHPAPRSLPR
jgi:glycerol-3-phosphate dehydrogenase